MPMMGITLEEEMAGMTMTAIGMGAGMTGEDIDIMMMVTGNLFMLIPATGREFMCRHRRFTIHPRHQFIMLHRHLALVSFFHRLLFVTNRCPLARNPG